MSSTPEDQSASFLDYRDYLKTRYLVLKKQRSISYAIIGKKLQVTKAFISHVILKKSHISIERIFLCVDAFKIPEDMIEYFLISYFYSINPSPDARVHIRSVLDKIVSKNTGALKESAVAGKTVVPARASE